MQALLTTRGLLLLNLRSLRFFPMIGKVSLARLLFPCFLFLLVFLVSASPCILVFKKDRKEIKAYLFLSYSND